METFEISNVKLCRFVKYSLKKRSDKLDENFSLPSRRVVAIYAQPSRLISLIFTSSLRKIYFLEIVSTLRKNS